MARTLRLDRLTAATGGLHAPEGNTPMAALARILSTTAAADDARLETLAAEVSDRWADEASPALADDDARMQHVATTADMVREMLEIPAQGLAGLRAKATGAAWCTGKPGEIAAEAADDLYGEALHSIACDLLALPGAKVHAFPQLAPMEPATGPSEMMRAAAEFIALKAGHAEAYARLLTTVAAAEALHPAPPAIIQDWQRPGHALSRSQLARHDMNAVQLTWPKPTGSPRVEAFDHWRAQVDAIDSSFGVPGLDEAAKRAAETEDKAAIRVSAVRPQTIQDAVVKYAVLLASWGDRELDEITSARVFFDFLSDLERLATASA